MRQCSASLLLVVLASCSLYEDTGTPSPEPEPDPVVTPPAGCANDFPDSQIVVACDFGPGIRPFAVADGRVYAVSPIGTYSAIELATAAKTRLFRYTFSSTTFALAEGSVVRNGRVYFPGNLIADGFVWSALLSADAIAATPDDALDVVRYFDRYELHAPMFGDGAQLYAASTIHEGFSVSSGPVVAISYDGNALAPRTEGYARPIGIAGDTLYYRRDRTIERAPKTGGTAEVIATGLSDASFFDRAVDDDAAYTTLAAAPYELRRLGANGATTLLATAPEGPGDLPLDPPHDLRRDGAWLYFMQNTGGSWATLARVRADGSSAELEYLASGQDLTPPVFDATGIYVGYTRGGSDEPIEGVVVRIAK